MGHMWSTRKDRKFGIMVLEVEGTMDLFSIAV